MTMNKVSTWISSCLLMVSVVSLQAQIIVSGQIACENGDPIEGAMVVSSLDTDTIFTDAEGNYFLSNVSPLSAISATYDELNTICVNTYDIHRIQKHILGIELFDNPYEIIAADYNDSNSITAFDIIMVSRVILGISDLPIQSHWSVINADYEFESPFDPFNNNETEFQMIGVGESDLVDANFIALKNGNTTIDCCYPTPPDAIWELNEETSFISDTEFVVRLNSSNFVDIVGFQFEITFDEEILQFVSAESSNLFDFNSASNSYLITPSRAAFSWFSSQPYGVNLNEEDAFLELTFELVDADIIPDEVFQFVTDRIEAELYRSDGFAHGIAPGTITNLDDLSYDKMILYNNPNPFTGMTTIHFNVDTSEELVLEIFDVNGRVIFKEEKFYDSGIHYVNIDTKICSYSGLYFYQLSSGNKQITKRMIRS